MNNILNIDQNTKKLIGEHPFPKTLENAAIEYQRSIKTFIGKLADYGTKDLQQPGQIIQRIKEKIGRIENLLELGGNNQVKDEGIDDAFLDIAGYSVIGNLIMQHKWGVEEERTDDKILITRSTWAKRFSLPNPKKEGDVGHDLYTEKTVVIPARNQIPVDVPTGVRIKLPKKTWAMIINRSSTPRKLGIEVVNGVIDEGYTGELFACVYNRTDTDIEIPVGTRLAQFLIFNSHTPEIREVEALPSTERGESGFGSTGT